VRTSKMALVAVLILVVTVGPGLSGPSPKVAAAELLLGTLGGVGGVTMGVLAIGRIARHLDNSRTARIAVVISGVTLGGGLGAAFGVLAAGRILGAEGNVRGCLVGALGGGLLSAFTEPLLYMLGVREDVGEFLGFLFLPIAPAAGGTLGFNWVRDDPG
jgi:hypothetical protein